MADEEFYCKSPLLDSTLFPVGTGRVLNSKYNILPFLCDLLKVANDETVSPVLVEPPEFDISPFTDFTDLNNFGDPRISLGVTLTETIKHFLPRVITQTEVLQSGGTRLIDTYICDSDGNPIKQSKTVPELNNTSYKYGAIEVPITNQTPEELMKPITGEEIDSFVNEYIQNSKIKHAEKFVQFIKKYYSDWSVFLFGYRDLGVFMVKLTDKSGTKFRFFKFYDDVKEKVACLFGKTEITIYPNSTNLDNLALTKSLIQPIPDYVDITSSESLQTEYFSKVEKEFSSSPDSTFSKVYEQSKTPTAQNANVIQGDINKKIEETLNLQTKVDVIKVNKC